MAEKGKSKSGKRAAAAKARKSERRLERRLDDLTREHRALRKRLKRLAREVGSRPPFPPFPPGRGPRFEGGRPPWVKGLGPIVSIEVPLETDDPTAPLWATVSARLPDELTAVGDDGRTVRYRYSAVGSTPQAPRYRQVADPRPEPPERFPV
jgi:hypothetical protein